MNALPLDEYRRLALNLAGTQMQAGERLRLRVVGTSMVPLLRPDDTVLVEAAAVSSLQLGEIVVVRRPQDWVVHRLVQAGPHTWQTKGDHQSLADSPVKQEDILGRVVGAGRGGREIDLTTAAWASTSHRMARLGMYEASLFARLVGRQGHPVWNKLQRRLLMMVFRGMVRLILLPALLK